MNGMFRVWDGEKMHEPPHGLLLDGRGQLLTGDGTSMDEYEVLFYTGLTDAEGTEIYEGDILSERDESLWVVMWLEGGFRVKPLRGQRWDNIKPLGWLIRKRDTLKVSVHGNKHESSELLEQNATPA